MQDSSDDKHQLLLVDNANTQSWRKRCDKFINESSFTSALYIFRSKSWLKRIVWAVVMLVSIGGFVTVTILNTKMLLDEPISTSITLTSKKELNFPAVTICNLNLFNLYDLCSIGGSGDQQCTAVYQLAELFSNSINKYQPSNLTGCVAAANKLAMNSGYNFSIGEMFSSFGNNFSDLLSSCSYNGEECTINDFTHTITLGGKCITFNGPESRKHYVAQGTGIRKGLQLQLLGSDLFSSTFSINTDFGYRVIIHNPDEPPRPESEGIAVSLRSNAYIGMRQIKSDYDTQYSSGTLCQKNDTIDRVVFFSQYSTYSQQLCQAECLAKYLLDQCGCAERSLYTPVSEKYRQFRNCTTPDICCEVESFFAVDESCECLPRCNTVEYPLTVSYATNYIAVGVNVYYESLTLETRKTTDSYTPWNFISDIGGNTGLFLGLTLLSWAEFMFLLVGLTRDCCCACSKAVRSRTKDDMAEDQELSESVYNKFT